MDDKSFKEYLKSSTNRLWHGSTIAFCFIIGLPLFGFTETPLSQSLWIAAWGFLAGSVYQSISNERDRDIRDKLTWKKGE